MKRKKRLRRKEYLALERKRKTGRIRSSPVSFSLWSFRRNGSDLPGPETGIFRPGNRALQQFPKASVDSSAERRV
ncbi:MAG: hypothetical protein ACLR2E_16565 [Lachnospiraceae bacterium]